MITVAGKSDSDIVKFLVNYAWDTGYLAHMQEVYHREGQMVDYGIAKEQWETAKICRDDLQEELLRRLEYGRKE